VSFHHAKTVPDFKSRARRTQRPLATVILTFAVPTTTTTANNSVMNVRVEPLLGKLVLQELLIFAVSKLAVMPFFLLQRWCVSAGGLGARGKLVQGGPFAAPWWGRPLQSYRRLYPPTDPANVRRGRLKMRRNVNTIGRFRGADLHHSEVKYVVRKPKIEHANWPILSAVPSIFSLRSPLLQLSFLDFKRIEWATILRLSHT
jgi:hypothetical protein